jgi:hypothetical protein
MPAPSRYPHVPANLYAGVDIVTRQRVSRGAVLMSKDGGIVWEPIAAGMLDGRLDDLAIGAGTTPILYASIRTNCNAADYSD